MQLHIMACCKLRKCYANYVQGLVVHIQGLNVALLGLHKFKQQLRTLARTANNHNVTSREAIKESRREFRREAIKESRREFRREAINESRREFRREAIIESRREFRREASRRDFGREFQKRIQKRFHNSFGIINFRSVQPAVALKLYYQLRGYTWWSRSSHCTNCMTKYKLRCHETFASELKRRRNNKLWTMTIVICSLRSFATNMGT